MYIGIVIDLAFHLLIESAGSVSRTHAFPAVFSSAHILSHVQGITMDNITGYFSPHVDVISRGSLTQGHRALDFSLKVQRAHDA